MSETKNAIIESTILGTEDHGIMSCMIFLEYGDSGHQGFGGYSLDTWSKAHNKRIGTAWGLEFIKRVLETLEVTSWEKLKGVSCRVIATNNKVEAIGHFIKDQWFHPKKDLDFLLETE